MENLRGRVSEAYASARARAADIHWGRVAAVAGVAVVVAFSAVALRDDSQWRRDLLADADEADAKGDSMAAWSKREQATHSSPPDSEVRWTDKNRWE